MSACTFGLNFDASHGYGQVALAKAVAEEDVDPSIVKCDAVPIQVAVPLPAQDDA